MPGDPFNEDMIRHKIASMLSHVPPHHFNTTWRYFAWRYKRPFELELVYAEDRFLAADDNWKIFDYMSNIWGDLRKSLQTRTFIPSSTTDLLFRSLGPAAVTPSSMSSARASTASLESSHTGKSKRQSNPTDEPVKRQKSHGSVHSIPTVPASPSSDQGLEYVTPATATPPSSLTMGDPLCVYYNATRLQAATNHIHLAHRSRQLAPFPPRSQQHSA